MRRPALVLLAALAIAAPGAHAQGTADRPAPEASRDPLDRRDWGAEVRRMRAAERAEVAGLSRRAREAAPGAAQAQAQRDLEEAKRQWRRRLLEAQLVRVRAAGLAEQALAIEARLAHLEAAARRRGADAPAGGAR